MHYLLSMVHFIEEAEQREKAIQQRKEVVQLSALEVVKNNEKKFLQFHELLVGYIKRVSNLSNESRRPVVEIGFTHLENEIKYEYFSSAYKTIVRKVFVVFKKQKIYNFWRRCYITITDKHDFIKLTLYEKGVSETNYADVIKKKVKIYVNVKHLNNNTALWIMDYLGYKISIRDVLNKIPHSNYLPSSY